MRAAGVPSAGLVRDCNPTAAALNAPTVITENVAKKAGLDRDLATIHLQTANIFKDMESRTRKLSFG